MVSTDQPEPLNVVDRLLWRDAQEILSRHSGAGAEGNCVWCARSWPCDPHRLALRADDASRQPWNEAWTARHDLYSLRAMPAWRIDMGRGRPRGGWHRAGNNRGIFA